MENLPLDVLHSIFDSLAHIDARSCDIPCPNLLSAIRVCRLWRQLGEEKLYRSIRIDQGPYYKMHGLFINPRTHPDPYKPRNRVTMLARTLYEHPDLAANVRRLEFRSLKSCQSCDPLMAKPCLEVVALCPRLAHLDIDDVATYDFHRLKTILSAKRELEYLSMTSGCGEDKPLFSSAEGLVHLMQSWSKLRTVKYDDFSWNENSFKQAKFPPFGRPVFAGDLPTHLNLPLRKLDLTSTLPLSPAGFEQLQSLSLPQLEVFSATFALTASEHDGTLADCLSSWSPTLTRLRLLDLSPSTKASGSDLCAPAARPRLAAALRSMPRLAALTISTRSLCPAELWTLDNPHLTELFYYALTQAEADAFAAELVENQRLPQLKCLLFNSAETLNLVRIEEACKARKIQFREGLWGGRFHHTYLAHHRFT